MSLLSSVHPQSNWSLSISKATLILERSFRYLSKSRQRLSKSLHLPDFLLSWNHLAANIILNSYNQPQTLSFSKPDLGPLSQTEKSWQNQISHYSATSTTNGRTFSTRKLNGQNGLYQELNIKTSTRVHRSSCLERENGWNQQRRCPHRRYF